METIIRIANCILGLIAVLSGLGFLFAPNLLIKLSKALDKKYSIETLRERLEKEIVFDDWVIRHRIMFAVVSLIVAAILLSQFFLYE